MSNWQHSVDFLAVGAGGGGMTGAIAASCLGMDALVIEQSQFYGGTTVMSGGVIWVPNNYLSGAVGFQDSEQLSRSYLQAVVPDYSATRAETYLQQAPRMLQFLKDNSQVRYDATRRYMDYYPEAEGGLSGGRSLDPVPFDSRKLGAEIERMAPAAERMRLSFSVTAQEAHTMMQFGPPMWWLLARRMAAYYGDIGARLRGLPDRRLTMGRALTARLRHTLMEKGVPLWLETKARELVMEDGRVAGLVAERGGEEVRIRARRGLLLASGGFAANQAMREKHLQQPTDASWSAASRLDDGSGIQMGLEAGGQLEHADCAWWSPSYLLPDGSCDALIVGKSMPGSIFVNHAGERFCNEAAPYEDVVKEQYRAHRDSPCIPCHLVFDAEYRHNYLCGPVSPGKVMPDSRIPEQYRGFLQRADTLEQLAGQIGVDAEGLRRTVDRHNQFARSGKDEDFGRGDSLHDRYYSDPKAAPNPNLRAIAKPPFYSYPVYPGDLGTKGGLRCDELARVLRPDGGAIENLYAAGNCSAAAMGDSYPGAGATIGAAMTFAYVAARHAAGAPAGDN